MLHVMLVRCCCFNVLPVSPTYTIPHSYAILYAAPLVLMESAGVLTFIRQRLKVRVVSSLGVSGICWGFDFHQAAYQGESCLKDCPDL